MDQIEELVREGSLLALTEAEEWMLSNDEAPNPRDGYVVSFTHFHTRGLGVPAHWFL